MLVNTNNNAGYNFPADACAVTYPGTDAINLTVAVATPIYGSGGNITKVYTNSSLITPYDGNNRTFIFIDGVTIYTATIGNDGSVNTWSQCVITPTPTPTPTPTLTPTPTPVMRAVNLYAKRAAAGSLRLFYGTSPSSITSGGDTSITTGGGLVYSLSIPSGTTLYIQLVNASDQTVYHCVQDATNTYCTTTTQCTDAHYITADADISYYGNASNICP